MIDRLPKWAYHLSMAIDSVLMECTGCWRRRPKVQLSTVWGRGRYCAKCRAVLLPIIKTRHNEPFVRERDERLDRGIDDHGRHEDEPAPKRSHKRKVRTRPWWDGTRWVQVAVDVRA